MYIAFSLEVEDIVQGLLQRPRQLVEMCHLIPAGSPHLLHLIVRLLELGHDTRQLRLSLLFGLLGQREAGPVVSKELEALLRELPELGGELLKGKYRC